MSAEALHRSALFRDFTEVGVAIFAQVAREKLLAAGAPLFVEGQPGESLFVVVEGTLRVVERGASGERDVAHVGPGDHVGGLAVLAPGPRLASAFALSDCRLLEISARHFAALSADKPRACLKLALAIAADVARRAREAREALRAPPDRSAG